jgi:hypothetical protein
MRWGSIVAFTLVTSALAGPAHASKAIPFTMKGCVIDHVYYQMDADSAVAVHWRAKFDVSPYEDKWIELTGTITPGDYFAAKGPPKVGPTCTGAQRELVRYAKAHEIRLDAARAQTAGKLDDADKLIEQAITFVTPADCDMFIDHAQIKTARGDLKTAAADIAILETKKCRFRGALNWLLLEELGNALRDRGAKDGAIKSLTLALANCDADICRDPITKDLATAKQMKQPAKKP